MSSMPYNVKNSDHNLLFLKFRLTSKLKIRRVNNAKKKYNLAKLKINNIQEKFQETVSEKIKEVDRVPTDPNEKWTTFKSAIKEAATEILGTTKNTPRKPWITEHVIELIEEGRKYKNGNSMDDKVKYRYWKNMVNREVKKRERNLAQRTS